MFCYCPARGVGCVAFGTAPVDGGTAAFAMVGVAPVGGASGQKRASSSAWARSLGAIETSSRSRLGSASPCHRASARHIAACSRLRSTPSPTASSLA
jgi:hypothetical protein